jgi:hypothetical protein
VCRIRARNDRCDSRTFGPTAYALLEIVTTKRDYSIYPFINLQIFMTTSNVRSLDIRAFQITFIGLLVLAFAILSFAGVMTAQAQETGPDYCDASQRPAGMSVAEWHEAESLMDPAVLIIR